MNTPPPPPPIPAPPTQRTLGERLALRPLLWWLALMLTLPAVIALSAGAGVWLTEVWPMGGPSGEAAPSAAAARWPGPAALVALAYLFGCGAIALGFALWCRTRRAVLALYALALLVLWASSDLLSLSAVLAAAAALALPVLLVELVRQNLPLRAELRAAGVPLWRPMASALWLWLPAVPLIALGLWLQSLLDQAGLRVAYGSGLVDRQCEIIRTPASRAEANAAEAKGAVAGAPASPAATATPGQDAPPAVVPCPLGAESGMASLTPLPLRRSLQADVQQQLADLRLSLIAQTSPTEAWHDERASREAFEAAAQTLRQRLIPPAPARGAVPTDPMLPVLQVRRSQVVIAEQQSRQLMRQWLVMAFSGPQLKARLRHQVNQREQLDREIGYRERQLAERRAEASKADPVGDLQRALADRLSRETALDQRLRDAQQRYIRALADAESPSPGLRRAVARGELLAVLRGIAPALVRARESVLRPQAGLALQAGLWSAWCHQDLPDDAGGHYRILRCPPVNTASASGAATGHARPLPLRENIDLSIEAWANRAETELATGLEAAGVQAFEAGQAGRGGARSLFDGVPATLGLSQPRCGLDPFCPLANWAKRRAEAQYRDFRSDAQRRFVREVDRRADLGVLSAHEQLDAARQSLADAMGQARDGAHRSVATLFALSDTLATLMAIWLVLVAVKSYLYVLALEVFHEAGAASLGFDGPASPEGRFEAQDGIVVPRAFDTPVLSFEVGVNQRKGLVLWKPWVAWFHRLLHGRWAMSRGSHTPQGQMQFPSRQGATGVCWQMAPGEAVVLNFAHLLGFSENVQLRSEVSLRLSTILFGRYVFHVARCPGGPGLLLLTVPGPAVLSDAAVHEVPLDRIKAFSRHARFRVASERRWRAVFKDGFNLRRVDGDPGARGLVLVGASTDGGLRFQGLLRFVKTFVWPL